MAPDIPECRRSQVIDLTIPVLQPVLKVLQVLDLGENLLGNEGIHIIRESLMVNCSVLQLSLAQANITCEGTIHLQHDFYMTYNVSVLMKMT